MYNVARHHKWIKNFKYNGGGDNLPVQSSLSDRQGCGTVGVTDPVSSERYLQMTYLLISLLFVLSFVVRIRSIKRKWGLLTTIVKTIHKIKTFYVHTYKKLTISK